MASFYGEILPVVSRAILDSDSEDDDDNEVQLQIEWQPHHSHTTMTNFKSLVLASGKIERGFVECHVENLISLGYLKEKKNEETVGSCYGKLLASFYYCNDVAFVFCNICNSSDALWEITNKLFESAGAEISNVTILTSASIYEYKWPKNTQVTQSPFVRSLRNNHCSTKPCFPPLEQPNMVTGLAAAALTHCTLHNISATVYVCYTDTINVDSESIEAFRRLLQLEVFSNLRQTKDQKIAQKIEALRLSPSNTTALYT